MTIVFTSLLKPLSHVTSSAASTRPLDDPSTSNRVTFNPFR
eukprot:CAMPEP_0185789520 /NCGR_PEP_ID=MMETSP1174-20130828/151476_1 /TAXON_ID=35687 /ORGANISM="Dictyocha speculum, Strain CCMP1381" /LENGTH=40 /DNA_ID= /DNA_START= /DNA_END= /DNA_ORIENTATION=